MSFSFKPLHLSRYKDIAWLLFKYGRGELVDAAGLDGGENPNGHAILKPVGGGIGQAKPRKAAAGGIILLLRMLFSDEPE